VPAPPRILFALQTSKAKELLVKLAFAGKGGAGKTTLCAWTADWLARRGHDVWLVDADTALSLGQASGLRADELPEPLVARKELIRERIGQGFINLAPDVGDLPRKLSVELPLSGAPIPGASPGSKRLLVMGTVTGAGGGCACEANALLKALLMHLIVQERGWVLVDLEAGVEHLGRGTVSHVDGLIVVSEPSMRSLQTAASIGALATQLGLGRQALVLNRAPGTLKLPDMPGLPPLAASVPALDGLAARQLSSSSVLGLPEQEQVDAVIETVVAGMGAQEA